MSRPRRGQAGPELTVALLVPYGRAVPEAVVDAARRVSEDVLVVGGPPLPRADAAVRFVPAGPGGQHERMATALGNARGRWTVLVGADESVHTPHARTLARYLRHETAAGFFVPMNDRLPLLRVLPTAAGRIWGADPLPAQALLEADPSQRLMTSEGLALDHGPAAAWTVGPTRPGDAWLSAQRALARGHLTAAARAAAALPDGVGQSAGGLALRGEIAFWREAWADAARLFEGAAAAAVQPFDPAAQTARLGIGRVHEAVGDLEAARAAYRAALATLPLDHVALGRLLSVEWRLGASWPETLGALVRQSPWTWRGVGRALDRVVRPEAQLRALRSMPMSYGRDLFLARAALAVGDLALARRCLGRAQRDGELRALGYQLWLTELAGGSSAEARAAAARASELTPSARLALLLAATSVLGESAELPLLRGGEALEVGQWLVVVLSDLALLGLGAQARQLARLIARVLGPAGEAQARAVLWRAAHPEPTTARTPRLGPARAIVIPRPGRAGPAWLQTPTAPKRKEVR